MEANFFAVRSGDLLVCRFNGNLHYVGKASIVAEEPRVPTVFPDKLIRLRPLFVRPEYIRHVMCSKVVREQIESVATTTAGNIGINGSQLRSWLIPIPPVTEQDRIIARVDELMGLLDRLEAARSARDEVRRVARDAALAALRDAEDAEAVEAAWARIARQMDALFTAPEDVAPLRRAVIQLAARGRLTGDDADTWTSTTLGEILVDGPANGWSPRAVEYPTQVMSLKLSATTRGYFDPTQFKFVEPDGPLDDRLWLEPGDLLIQRSNTLEYVGVSAIYYGLRKQYIYPDLMMRCRVSPNHDVRFVHMAISAPEAREWISARASGTSQSMVKINQATVRSIPLRMPEVERQRCIVETTNRFLTLCDQLEARLSAVRELQAQFAAAAVHHLDV